MPSDEPLTDKATVKGKRGLYISTTDWDSAIEAWIKAASRLITDGLGRELHRVDGETEKLGSRGGRRLYLRDRLPVHAVTSVEYDGDTVDAGDYYLEAESEGELVHDGGGWRDTSDRAGMFGSRQDPRPPEKLYKVTYDGGFVTPVQAPFGSNNLSRDLPHDVEQAVIDYCVMQYRQAGNDKTVGREKFAGQSMTYEKVNGRRVPASVADVIDRLRKPAV
ncbi:MAG: hypothetical protein ABEN55_21690 [Bradymonadaceae bacterium]